MYDLFLFVEIVYPCLGIGFFYCKKGGEMLINGKEYDFKDQKLTELFDHFKINSRHVIVELNGRIIERNDFDNLVVNYQDELEIVTFVGGG